MLHKGLKLNTVSYNILIRELCQVRRVAEAQKLSNEMPAADLSPDLFTYLAMIDGLFKNGHFEEAMALLQSLERDKYELNIEVYSLVIDGLRRVGRLEEARKKLDQLTEKGLVPDVVTYIILINGLCVKGMKMEAVSCLSKWKRRDVFQTLYHSTPLFRVFL